MKKNKGGRPSVMTDVVLSKLEHAFSLGCSDREACDYAGVGEATLYKYQDRNPKFVERKNILKERMIFKARESVMKGIETNPDLALKVLERRKRDEFSLKTEQKFEGKVDGVVVYLPRESDD